MNFNYSEKAEFYRKSAEYEYMLQKEETLITLKPFLEEYAISSDDFEKCFGDLNNWCINERIFRNLTEVLGSLDWLQRFEALVERQRSNSYNWLSGLEIKIEDFRQRIRRGNCAIAYKAAINGTLNEIIPEGEVVYHVDDTKIFAYSFSETLVGIGIARVLRKLEIEHELLKNAENKKLEGGLSLNLPSISFQSGQKSNNRTETNEGFKPIIFNGSARLLAQCMKTFQTMNLCPQEADIWVWASKAFVRSNGLPFNNLAQALDGGTHAKSGKPNGSDEFDSAILAVIESDKWPIAN